MKKNLLLMAALGLSCLTTQAQDWDCPEEPTTGSEVVSGHKYQVRVVDEYLQNMELDYRLAGGASWYSWETSLILVDKDVKDPLTFTLTEAENGWTLQRTTDNKYTFISGAHASGWGEMHVDQGSQNANLHFFGLQRTNNGTYRIYPAPVNATQCNKDFGMSLSTTEPELFWGWQQYDEEGMPGDYEFAVYPAVNPADGFATEWEFIDYSIYDARVALYDALMEAVECEYATIDYSAAEKVYLDENATMETIVAATKELKATIKNAEANAILTGASEEEPADGTSLLVNPDFELGNTSGWDLGFTGGTNVTNLGYQGASYTNAAYTYENHNGEEVNPYCTHFIEAWANSDFGGKGWRSLGDGYLSQTLPALPAGKYKFTCDAIAVIQDRKSQAPEGVQLFAIGGDVDISKEIVTGDGVPEHVELTFISSGGDITLGLRTVGATANWIAADNFELMYYGEVSENVYQALLEDYIATAEKTYPVEEMEEVFANNDKKAAYIQALDAAKNLAATNGLTDEDYQNAQKEFKAVVDALAASVNAYESLNNAIDNAENRAAGMPEEWEALADQISDKVGEWRQGYTDGTYDDEYASQVSEEVSSLIADYISQNCKAGDDITILLVNPSFDAQTIEGWTCNVTPNYGNYNYCTGRSDVANTGGTMAPQTEEEEAEHAAWGSNCEVYKTKFRMSQTIKNMPKGLYEFSCQGFWRNDGNNGDPKPYLFYEVNGDETTKVTNAFAACWDERFMTEEEIYSSAWADKQYNGMYYPDNMTSALYHFHHSNDGETLDYTSKINVVLTESGDITIGCQAETADYWVIFDNFKIIYKGAGASVYAEAIAEAIAEGNRVIEATRAEDEMGTVKPGISTACDNEWQTLCGEAEEALASGDGDLAASYLQKLTDFYNKTVPASAAALQALADEYAFTEDYRSMDLETSYDGLKNIMAEVYNALYGDGVESDEAATDYIAKIRAEFSNAVMYDAQGSEAEPADVTAVIVGAGFDAIGEASSMGWTAEGNMAVNDNGAEFYNQASWTISQDIYNLKAGFYRLKVNGFYRAGGFKDGAMQGTDDRNVMLFAGEAQTPLVSIFTENMANYDLGGTTGIGFDGEETKIPYSMGEAAAAFNYIAYDEETGEENYDGLYLNVLQFEVTEADAVKAFAQNAGAGAASVLKIGLTKQDVAVDADWTMFDNFRLEYLGTTEPSEDPTTAVETVTSASPIKAVTIYGINGAQQSRLQKGVNIVKTVKADGSVKMVKVLVK